MTVFEISLLILAALNLLLIILQLWQLRSLTTFMRKREVDVRDDFNCVRMDIKEFKELQQSFMEEIAIQNDAMNELTKAISDLREDLFYLDTDLETVENRIIQLEYRPSAQGQMQDVTPPPRPLPSPTMRKMRRRVVR